MRTNDSVWTRSLWSLAVALVATGLTASNAAAADVHLIAAPVTKTIALPDGNTVAVPMWGYALDLDGSGTVNGSEAVTVPGPRIVVPAGDASLTVTLTNLLPDATSLVIPGQAFDAGAAAPARAGIRATSMTPETAPGGTGTYVFPSLKPGTFLYQSGSHQAVQVQMGLYGAMTQDAVAAVPPVDPAPGSPAEAYAGVPYAQEVVLVYSEIDQALHAAVAAGAYGDGKAVTSAVDYRPSLFLINGASYTNEAAAAVAAGTAGQTTLLRILNAGLRTHAPVLDHGSLRIVAEDGNPLPYAKDQATVLLAAGKTHDALWTPAASGVYSLYDRTLGLNAPGQGSAGMLAKLSVASAGAPDAGAPVAVADAYAGTEDGPAIGGNVLANDSNAVTADLVAYPRAGTLSISSSGAFTYTPNPNFSGVDEFAYRAVNGTGSSAPALVTITVAPVADAPVAIAQSVGVDKNGSVAVILGATDADGDPLRYYLASTTVSHGTVSYIDPVDKVQKPLASSATEIPSGVVIFTPTPGYPSGTTPGAGSFTFRAFDGTSYSNVAIVDASVFPVESAADDALTQPINLAVVGADGAAIGSYRWTLEEDLTFKVDPDAPDPTHTLAVSFHKSYMPVVAAGTSSDPVLVNPAKRYFVSILPTDAGTYSNGGAAIDVGQTSATITVAKLPLPTARIRVRVFQDNAPLNGAWDTGEAGLAGFQVTIDDAGGTYGMSGGHQSTDAFGNKIGTTYKPCTTQGCDPTEVDSPGDGFVLSGADGYAMIENLVMGKYTVKVRAPGGQQWIQTSTIEGTPGIDAWVKPNEPQYFAEFGPPGPHVEVGFTRVLNTLPTAGGYTISGRVTNLRQSRPPEVAQFSGAPFDAQKHTRTWVALNSGATGGNLLYAQPTVQCEPPMTGDGCFSIAHVPNGSYQIVVFDKALDLIIGTAVVNVAGAAKNVGDVAVFSWFTNLYAYVFDDINGDGIHQSNEPGISDQALNIRFRDGSIYQSLSTAENGFKAFNEVFPFFAWMVAEVDYTRFHSTGLTVAVDAGGDASAPHTCPSGIGMCGSNAYDWQGQMGLPPGLIPPETLNPQLQPDNGMKPFRTESGAETPFLLLEGFQGFIGQSTVMLWGKAPYAPPGSIPEDVNVAPFDDYVDTNGNGIQDANEPTYFPGPGDVDGNKDKVFNTDHFNGGIAGIVHYAITRAENDPRWAAAENWEPGVSDVRVQLWDENRTHLLNEVTTDNWNNSLPAGCQWPNNVPYVYQGQATDCFDGLRNFNQARPALFDGGYAFSTILQDSVSSATYNLPIDQRGVARPIPAGRYVVKIIVPPGYRLQKEEDKNVDFGDTYVPQQFWLTGFPLADAGGGPGDAQPAPTVQDNALIAPFCVGQLHKVPPTLSLFPDQQTGTYKDEDRPLCDAKLVTLRDGQQVAPDFHLFTEAPVAGHVYGMVLDDTTNEFDPNKPTFGEKYAVPFIGVAIRDWQGREITRGYTDQYGMYNLLVPSMYTANPPEPSGVSPSILSACINPPTMPGQVAGTVVPDPHFQKQYSHFCYPLQYLPGKTTYLDTPVVPTGAFTGNGTFPVDAELPNGTPVIAQVNGTALNLGPYIVDDPADAASRTVVITSAGTRQVPNPLWDGTTTGIPKLVARDYGFGGTQGSVLLGGEALSVTSWSNDSIMASVPAGLRTGQLSIVKADGRKSVLGITLSVATPSMHAIRPPKVVPVDYPSIQAAIDNPATKPGDLILVKPGVYEEMVVMTKPVRLQGFGALSTAINVVTTPSEQIQAWLGKMGDLLLKTPSYLVPNQPAMTPAPFQTGDVAAVVGDEGPGVMVLSKSDPVTPLTGWCLSTSLLQPATNFATPANEAYCLHNENYSAPTTLGIANLVRGSAGSGGGGTGLLGRRLVTVTTSAPHGFSSGNQVVISGVTVTIPFLNIVTTVNQYNGTQTISVTGPATFTYTVPNQTLPVTSYSGATVQLAAAPSSAPAWRPNARIDGFSLIGASNAPGVLVNGYAHYLEVSNNKVYTNSGTYAGGIQVGHAGAAAPFNDEDARNDNVSIHNNMVTANAAIETGGGGGIVLGTGSTSYSVKDNFVAANFTAGNGGGIAHIGRSELGVIDRNTVIFNESFLQASGTNGGGMFIGGTLSTPGSGEVFVTNNLVLGNAASGGDGGGIALLGFASSDRVHLYNNMIANNVAGLAGGGVSIEGVPTSNGDPVVDMVHDTIVHNDSTGTAGGAFLPGSLTSTPQPAGVSGRGSSMSRVRIANSIVWQNRTFYFGPCSPLPAGSRCGIVPVSPTPGTVQYAEIQTGQPYWDLANLSGSQFNPTSSVLTSTSGPTNATNYLNGTNNVTYASSNTSAAPAFVSTYFNADRQKAYQPGETTGEATLISVPAALDEGGNFIRPQYGPLTLEVPGNPPTGQRYGDYHVSAGVTGATLCSIFGCIPNNLVPNELMHDIDGDGRDPSAPHRGADQASATVVPPSPPTLASVNPQSGAQGTSFTMTLSGSNLTGATAVNVSGTGVACGVVTATASTITANCTIATSAPTGVRNVSVATPGGTSGTVAFSVSGSGIVTFTSASLGTLGGGTLAFGSLNGSTNQSIITVSVSVSPVQFGNVTVQGGNGNRFSEVNGGTCQNATVPPGSTCTVIVNFNATGTTNRTGGLTVPHNGVGSPATLTLTGQ